MKPGLARAFVLSGAALLASGIASADSISGTISAGFGQVGVSLAGTDFFGFNSADSQCDKTGAGAGCFDILSGTGSFASLVNSNAQINTIQDLPSPPLSGSIPIKNFISFDGGAITFDLVTVLPGGGQDCSAVNQSAPNLSCTIYANFGTVANPDIQGSPWLLTNGPDDTTLSIAATMYFNGYSGDPANGVTVYRGIFSTQLSGTDINAMYNLIVGGGTGTSSWSASFSPVTSQLQSAAPEPGSVLLMGMGLIGLAYRCRKTR
jgi:hypothetical protein